MSVCDDTLQADGIEVARPLKSVVQPARRASSIHRVQDALPLPAKPLLVGEQTDSDAFALAEEAETAHDPDAGADQEAKRRGA